jgi:quercetin dioxygenase-like cupin family protein
MDGTQPLPVVNASLPVGAVTLARLVEAQQGSVVSKTLVKKPTGTITLFAFDQGQALSEHTASFDALIQLLEGEAEISIGGTPCRVHGGEAIFLPGGIPHAVHAVAPFKMLLTMIRS